MLPTALGVTIDRAGSTSGTSSRTAFTVEGTDSTGAAVVVRVELANRFDVVERQASWRVLSSDRG